MREVVATHVKKHQHLLHFNYDNIGSRRQKNTFGRDRIFLDYIFGEMALKRYYKSDWGGMMVSTSGLSTLMSSLNCRSNVDKIDETITDLERNGY